MKKLQAMKNKKGPAVKMSTIDDVFAQTQRIKPKGIVDMTTEEEEQSLDEKPITEEPKLKQAEKDTVENFLEDTPEQFMGKPKLTATNDSSDDVLGDWKYLCVGYHNYGGRESK